MLGDTGEQYSGFAALLLTIPPRQAQQLLAQSGMPQLFQWQEPLLEPCWAVAVRTLGTLHSDAIFCQHPKLSFVSHQATKSGRNNCYIFHFGADFSRANLEQPAEFWFEQTEELLRSELGIDDEIEPVAAHRWFYASLNPRLEPPGIIELFDGQLWAGGDWSYGRRVENAYLAGLDLADATILHGN